MRLTSSFWVSALVRRVFDEGAYAAIRKKGSQEAGAIFIVMDGLDGTADLYGPLPQMFVTEKQAGERLFERLIDCGDALSINERLQREARMDDDFWVVDIDDRSKRRFFEVYEHDDDA